MGAFLVSVSRIHKQLLHLIPKGIHPECNLPQTLSIV